MGLECIKADCFGNVRDRQSGRRRCRILKEALGSQGVGCPFYKTKKQLEDEKKATDARLMEKYGMTARDYMMAISAYTENDAMRYLDE